MVGNSYPQAGASTPGERTATISDMTNRILVPLPRDWNRVVKRALLAAIGLERLALLDVRAGFEHSSDPRASLFAALDAARERIEQLEEETRVLRARLECVPPANRPQYPPVERLAILALRARAGWNNAHTAKRFLVTAKTIARWMRRLDEDGPDALVQMREPVNRFDDAVTALVHQLHRAAPGKGRRMKADLLARAGLHLASSTVRRLLHRPAPKPRPTVDPPRPPRPTQGVALDAGVPGRVVTAKHPHHVWHIDLTTIPIGPPRTGFWVA